MSNHRKKQIPAERLPTARTFSQFVVPTLRGAENAGVKTRELNV